MSSIFSHLDGPVKEFLTRLMSDDRLREKVTYKKYVSGAHSQSAGYKVIVYNSYSLSGVRLRHNRRSMALSSGAVSAGDEVFLFRADDLPSGISLKDQIVDAEDNTSNVGVIDNVFGLAVLISIEGSNRSIP